MTIKIGDRVRSFDFAMGEFGRDLDGERASFVEGTVEAIGAFEGCGGGCPHFHIRVTREMSSGLENFHREGLVGELVFPPSTPDHRGEMTVELIDDRAEVRAALLRDLDLAFTPRHVASDLGKGF